MNKIRFHTFMRDQYDFVIVIKLIVINNYDGDSIWKSGNGG